MPRVALPDIPANTVCITDFGAVGDGRTDDAAAIQRALGADLAHHPTLDALVNLQRDILDNVCRHLRPGGILVYAVCTITAEECENQVADFLARHPNFRQDALPGPCFGQTPPSQVKFMPHVDGCDGFFVARFVRET